MIKYNFRLAPFVITLQKVIGKVEAVLAVASLEPSRFDFCRTGKDMSNEEETSNLCKPAISGLCVTHSKAILAVASAQLTFVETVFTNRF